MPRPAVRAVLSVLFACHLLAVFVAPMTSAIMTAYSIFPASVPEGADDEPPPTPWLNRLFQPYLDAAYLNHGYGFFAPDPGPSHLIRYTIDHGDGRQEQGIIPSRAHHWPRLRYHRHFMLAEQAHPNAGPAYARHLLKKHHARRVTVKRVRHFLLRPEEVLTGMRLDAQPTYQSLGTIRVDDNEGGGSKENAS